MRRSFRWLGFYWPGLEWLLALFGGAKLLWGDDDHLRIEERAAGKSPRVLLAINILLIVLSVAALAVIIIFA